MIAKKFLLYLVLCLGKIFLLLLCTVLWTFRFFPTTVQRAVSNALRFVARVGQQRPVNHLLPRPRWDWAVLLADETSTVLEQHILFPGLVLGHHHDVAGAAKPLLLQDHPVPLLHRQHVGLAGRRDGDPLCPLFKVAPTRVVAAVEQQFLVVLDASLTARAPLAPLAVDAVLWTPRSDVSLTIVMIFFRAAFSSLLLRLQMGHPAIL